MVTCPTCGSECQVVGGDEGTQHFAPVDGWQVRDLRREVEGLRERVLDRERDITTLQMQIADEIQVRESAEHRLAECQAETAAMRAAG